MNREPIATRLYDAEGRDLRNLSPDEVEDGLDIFSERGIVPPWRSDGEVARARGYVRYERGDTASVYAAEPRLEHGTYESVNPLFGRTRPAG